MEDPRLLLGIPLLVLGGVGALVALATLVSAVRIPAWWFEPAGGQPRPPQVAPAAAARGEGAHPGPAIYVRVAMAMAVVEALEVVVYYAGVLGDSSLSFLLLLTVVQFALIAMWFMHLRFDSRLFSWLLVGGLVLAFALFIVVLAIFGASLV